MIFAVILALSPRVAAEAARNEKPQPLTPHIPEGGEHGYGDEEKDREDNHRIVGHRAPAS
jgi:hypothetical protein